MIKYSYNIALHNDRHRRVKKEIPIAVEMLINNFITINKNAT